jgi:Response regulator containing CheY-like receiver, AAA-type ATPase, and DNA-binding domains
MEWKTILIVDADTTARSKLYEVLFSKGHAVTCVPTGKEALAALTDKRFEVIILDGALPDIAALDAVKAIRRFDMDTKILILDARGMPPEERASLRDAQVTAVVPKDFASPEMMRSVFEALRVPDEPGQRAGASRLSKEIILVVDDNEEVRKTIELFLKKKGYNVRTAASGEDALMKIKLEKTGHRIP